MSKPLPATGVVLVGGRSTRMGVDKATMEVGGRCLAGLVADALGAVCVEVLLAGRPVPGVDARVVADPVAGAGPLAGLVAAAGAACTPLLLAAACDMPSLVPALLDGLVRRLAAAPQHGAALCASAAGLEPFPLVLRVDRAGVLAAALDAGRLRLRDVLDELDPLVVAAAEWTALDPAGLSFVNWNTPDDVRQAAPVRPRIPDHD